MSLVLHPDGKIEIKNSNTNIELLSEIVKILDEIKGALTTPGIWEYINTAGAVTPCTVNAPNVITLTAELETIINKIDGLAG